jgi:hypothetical protein
MITICGMIILLSVLIGVLLFLKKRYTDCFTNPAIRCWKDWKCSGDSIPPGLDKGGLFANGIYKRPTNTTCDAKIFTPPSAVGNPDPTLNFKYCFPQN